MSSYNKTKCCYDEKGKDTSFDDDFIGPNKSIAYRRFDYLIESNNTPSKLLKIWDTVSLYYYDHVERCN